ncbi:TadE family protein [Dactylosporangium sp. NPDC051485]|uniref:TadE/TadG family type IV pilus assembly protein n=1 Tax=Dactylosporangium sp. NPDC051485 TaxID=3154846 RepID=UPI0034303C40
MTSERPAAGAAQPPRREIPRPRRGQRDDHGSGSIEFVITAAAVLVVVFLAIQAANFYYARSIAVAAAQEAVDAQRAYNAAPGAGQTEAEAFIASAGDSLSDVRITVTSDGRTVQATVDGHCLSIVPGFCAVIGVHATAHGTVERVTSP